MCRAAKTESRTIIIPVHARSAIRCVCSATDSQTPVALLSGRVKSRRRIGRRTLSTCLFAATCWFVATSAAWAGGASFQGLGDLHGGTIIGAATAVSADGSTVVGYSSSSNTLAGRFEAFRWTAAGGMVGIGDLPGGEFNSYAYAVSADGSAIVGWSASATPGAEAFRWTQAGGMVGLGHLGVQPSETATSFAQGISADGSVVVGRTTSPTAPIFNHEAFRWVDLNGNGLVDANEKLNSNPGFALGDLSGPGGFKSEAYSVSADGSVVVGVGIEIGDEAFRWTQAGGMVGLGYLPNPGFLSSRAFGVSADGAAVVGQSYPGYTAFRWMSGTGMVALGVLPGATLSKALAASADGSVVVGDSQGASGLQAFIWDSTNGIRNLKDVLENDYGLDLTGWTLYSAGGISNDGLTIVGSGQNPGGNYEAFMAHLVLPDDDGDGVPNSDDLCPSTPEDEVGDVDADGCSCVSEDTSNPTIACPADVSVSADAGSCNVTGVDLGEPVTYDNCGVDQVTNDAPAKFGAGDTTVTWTVTDVNGLTATCEQIVTVNDDEDPTITCPADVNVSADSGACTASGVDLGAPVTEDNCGVDTVANDAPAAFPVGATTVTWTVNDVNGRTADCEQTVTVSDDEDPTIACPADVFVSTNAGACTASGVDLGVPVTDDNCGVDSVSNDAPAVFPTGATTVTWTVTDVKGRTATCEQTVTVTDDEDPTITCPDDVTVTVDSSTCSASGIDLGAPTIDDNCGVDTVTNDAPAVFPVGSTTVTWTVTDVNGATADCEQTVTVTDDEDPTIVCPADVTVSADPGACTASGVSLGAPAMGDNCGVDSVTNDSPAAFPVGTTTVTWTVTDVYGRTTNCQQSVTVTDDEAPTISSCPTDRTLSANANCEALVPDVTGEAAVTDNCDSNPTLTQSPAAGTVIDLSGTQITVSATDASGNTATCTVTISVDENGCNDPPPSPDTPPDTPPLGDQDGVDAATENAAPNNGDGNGDGAPDSTQNNVTSLPNINGDYLTIAAPAGTMLANVSAGGNPSPGDAPPGFEFPAGFLSFEVLNLSASGIVDIEITAHLSPGVTINSFWKYGPEPGNPAPHWYEFLFDGTTGATFSGNLITLRFVDGLRGDGDLTADGVITDPGAPAATPTGSTAQPIPTSDCGAGLCGPGSGIAMPFMLVGLAAMRRRGRRSRNRTR